MASLSLAVDLWALWFITLVLMALLGIFLYWRILNLSTKLSVYDKEIRRLEKTLQNSVQNIDVTLHNIMEEMDQSGNGCSSTDTDARMSVDPPVDTCVIELVEDWLQKTNNGPIQDGNTQQDQGTECDAWGIKLDFYESLGHYEKYPVKEFQFKCLRGKDPNT